MALTTAEEVLEETGADYADYDFANLDAFKAWITKKINAIDIKIQELVGTYYVDPDAIPDLTEAEINWTFYKMLKRKQSQLSASIESGFALGSLRIDSSAGPSERLQDLASDLFKRVRAILDRYCSCNVGRYLIVEDPEDTE